MKKNWVKTAALFMSAALLMTSFAPAAEAKTKKPALAKKKLTVSVGTTKKVAIKHVTKRSKITIKQSKSSRKKVKITWKKSAKKLYVKGRKKGSTTAKIRVKMNQKTTRLTLKIRVVSSSATKTNLPTQTPPSSQTDAGTVSPTPYISPMPNNSAVPTDSSIPTIAPTPSITPKPTRNPYLDTLPTYTGSYSGDDSIPVKDIYKDYFMMGAALNGMSNTTMALNHTGMTGILQKHFNSTVLSNLMKPEFLLDETASKQSSDGMPVCKFDTCDPALKFCMDNGIKMRGHTLIWHNQTPDWFFYEDYDTSKSLVDAATMEQRMDSYFRQIFTHCQEIFPGVIYCWDVVNECISTDANSYVTTAGGWKLRASTLKDNDFTHDEAKKNFWHATMGETYVEKAFACARKYADKDVKLFYNDFNVFQREKRENIFLMVKELKEKGLIDGLGLQPTVLLTYPQLDTKSSESFYTCLSRYSELDVELQVTELSFKINLDPDNNYEVTESLLAQQADRYHEFMNLLLRMDSDNGGPCNITSVTVFGICDDYPLYEDNHQNLYLWDKNGVPKPCFYSYIQPGLDLLASKGNPS